MRAKRNIRAASSRRGVNQHPAFLHRPIRQGAWYLATTFEIVTRKQQEIDANSDPADGGFQTKVFCPLILQVWFDYDQVKV
jgi:hypothetical protein